MKREAPHLSIDSGHSARGEGEAIAWMISFALIGAFFSQIVFFFTLMSLEGVGKVRAWAASFETRNEIHPVIYWGAMISALLGCVLGAVVAKLMKSKARWYRFSTKELFLLMGLVSVLLSFHYLFYRLPV
jgi:hypothetical protein